MDKKEVLIVFLVIILFGLSFVNAASGNDTSMEETRAGITPDSIFWGLDRTIEKIQLLLTFDVAKKAELRLKIADERLAEIEVMIEKNKVNAREKAEVERENEIEELKGLSEEIDEKDSTVIVNIQENLQKHIDKLKQVKEKAPEDAQEGLANAIDESSKVLDKFQTEGGGGRAIGVPIEREQAPEWILDKAKEHIVSYVGEKYFDEHISVKKSWTEPTVDKIGAKYRIYYTYKFKIKGDLDETSIEFVLWLDLDRNLVEYSGIKYRGPQKPYLFNISKKEAEEIAKEEGLPESTTKIIEKGGKTYNITKLTTATIEFGPKFSGVSESYIWYVTTENYEVGKPVAVYIDVDSGEVLGVYIEEKGEVSPDIN